VIVVGLTGGIASGKSTVSDMLRNAGATIIDADEIARLVVQRDKPAYQDIVNAFGRSVLLPDGEIDRQKLGAIVFHDSAKKEALNRIVHPRVIAETAERLRRIEAARPQTIVILDVPLLIEARMHESLSDIIVVYAPEEVQLHRLMHRNRFSRKEALARIRAQMPIEAKKKFATILIDNSGSLEQTRAQTREAFNYLKSKSAKS
jgi:dephospho-CoA kinase